MHCKNCGEQYAHENAVICLKCGAQRNQGNAFCGECGEPIKINTIICTKCGCKTVINQKSKVTAGLLGIFLGELGIHNFYLENTERAVTQLSIWVACCLMSLCTLGISLVGCLAIKIWSFVEGVQILTGNISVDGKGVPLN